jgi:hypothetical protein
MQPLGDLHRRVRVAGVDDLAVAIAKRAGDRIVRIVLGKPPIAG